MATQPVVLLIGRSLTLAAIAAGLRDRPEVSVRQAEVWAPRLTTGQAAPDVVIVDGAGTAASAVALLAAYPRVLLLEVGAGVNGDLQVNVHHSEQRPLGNGADLASLILEHAQAVAAGAADDGQVTGAALTPQNQDRPSTTARRVS